MTVAQLEALKEKIEVAKAKKVKNELALEQIKEVWQREFSVSTTEEVEQLMQNMKKDFAELESRIADLSEKLGGFPWDLI